jgi:two-component system response regulator VicR
MRAAVREVRAEGRDMAAQERILLLEDDPNLGLIIKESLERRGFDVTLRVDGEEGLRAYRGGEFDLCLIDVMMPVRDGFSFAQEVRRGDDETPLVFLTARALVEDRIAGFRIGCDDYVTKPFSMEELLLRIDAVLRRRRTAANRGGAERRPAAEVFAIGWYTFDYRRQVLRRDEEERRLTDKESELLRLLCLHRDQVLERSLALREIWGEESYHCSRSMDVFISRLRKYLKDDPRIAIRVVHGRGFRLMVD